MAKLTREDIVYGMVEDFERDLIRYDLNKDEDVYKLQLDLDRLVVYLNMTCANLPEEVLKKIHTNYYFDNYDEVVSKYSEQK